MIQLPIDDFFNRIGCFSWSKVTELASIDARQLLCFLVPAIRLSMAPDIGKECRVEFVPFAPGRPKSYAFEMGRLGLGDLSLREKS
ncbi:MAG TPA: hypothetical protein VIX37_02425 [Candidatus Sulfotelmatobacter sp.]